MRTNRNVLIEKTNSNTFEKWEEYISSEEKIVLGIKWKLNEIVSPKQVIWDYNYLSNREEIISNFKKYAIEKKLNIDSDNWIENLETEFVEKHWNIDIDKWIEKEKEYIKNSIYNNAKDTLKWLTWLSCINHPDHIPSEVETIIFTYAIQYWIYTEEEISSIKFDHWETKEYYINKYWVSNQDELLSKLEELWKEKTKELREYKKNNPEEESHIGLCSWICFH